MADTMNPDLLDDVGSDSDDDYDDDNENKWSPWKKSFNELKTQMELMPNCDGLVYKRIITDGVGETMSDKNCRIHWRYSKFMEGEETSFDFKTETVERTNIALKGIHWALATMRKKEEAQFIIGYQIMFGALGCPPRIKQKADILLVVKLIDFVEIGDENACDDLPQEDLRKFHIVKDKVIEMHKKALDLIRSKQYRKAISVHQSAIRKLEFCQLANEEEQIQQQSMLFDYYLQLAECYFKIDDWKKLCLTVNELRRRNVSKVNKHVNILVNEAIAISHIEDDYKRAIQMMRKIQLQNPNNERINQELDNMCKKKEKYDEERKEMCKRIFKVQAKAGDI